MLWLFSPRFYVSPGLFFPESSVLMATYLEKTQHVCNTCVRRVDLRTQLLTAMAWELQRNPDLSALCLPSPLHPLNPGSSSGVWGLRPLLGPRLRAEQGVPAAARAAPLLDAIRPTLINQTLSMNENVIKEINCRNTCTNKNPLTYLLGIPVRKH